MANILIIKKKYYIAYDYPKKEKIVAISDGTSENKNSQEKE